MGAVTTITVCFVVMFAMFVSPVVVLAATLLMTMTTSMLSFITMMAATVHARDARKVYCVSRCGQVFGTEDGGDAWREYRLPPGVEDVYAIACA